MIPSTFLRRDVVFDSEGIACAGWLYVPSNPALSQQRPAIVMAHGWSAVKEMSLSYYAEAFVTAGFVVLVFDYRFLGASGGKPRQRIIPSEQQQDYRNAISWIAQQPEVDPARIGLWGSSYSGGHVIEVAAVDKRVKAVVAQIPAVNTSVIAWHWIRYGWHKEVWKAIKLSLKQIVWPFTTHYIPVINDPGEAATLPGQESRHWFMKAAAAAPTWRNKVTVSSSFAGMRFKAMRAISRIAPIPLLMVVASKDEIVLTAECLKAFQLAGEPKQLLQVKGGHFDFFQEPVLSTVLPEEIKWFNTWL